MPVNVRIPDDLRDRIDAARPSTTSREAWVRAACEAALGSPRSIEDAARRAVSERAEALHILSGKSPAARKPRPKGGKR